MRTNPLNQALPPMRAPSAYQAEAGAEAPRSSFSFTAGRAIRRPFREMLEAKKFRGSDIEWIEQKRFVESTFVVKGSPRAVTDVRGAIERMIAMMERE